MTQVQAYIDSINQSRFRYGEHDCVQVAAGLLSAHLGREIITPQYKGIRGVSSLFREADARGLLKMVKDYAEAQGWVLEQSPTHGSLVLFRAGSTLSCGIVFRNKLYASASEGVSISPLFGIIRSWRTF